MTAADYRKHRVHMHSLPGMWAFYEGYVDVWATNDTQAKDRALEKLRRGSFFDRPRSAWVIEKIERI